MFMICGFAGVRMLKAENLNAYYCIFINTVGGFSQLRNEKQKASF